MSDTFTAEGTTKIPMARPHQTFRYSEAAMSDNDDFFGESENEGASDFDRLSHRLFEHVNDFADEEDIADEVLALLLLQLSGTIRMMTYAMSVAKPSGGGLRLELDRFRRDADELLREMKKNADQFIARAKVTIAENMLGEEDDEA